ncbi:MAG: flagellar hook-length control protein FliK, partial [Oscillospiraceae bacterium]|nr:flagellar hook-length control protein FliK [Oscillospiraceae bacterium]
MVMGVSETVPAIPAFSDITDAFADMISTELLSQYIAKNYPLGTGGQNPKEEFSGEVRDVVFDIMEDYSGFTKTQMNNPNMTADVMGLDKIVTDDFIEDITSDIISVVFNGDINDKQLAGQVIKNAVEQTMINPVNVVPQQEAVVNEEPTEIREVQPEQIPNTVPGGETVNYADNTAADSVVQVHENAMPVSDAEPIETDEPGVRMIAMTDGTYIPESAIMDSPNMPDANGIYPAGTQYIKATPYIGPGDSPAKAVLMAKVGDEDGLVRPSDFVKARGITFTPHENVRELSDGWVYMPIEEQKVMGITEYNAQGEFAGNNEEKREPAQQDMTGGDFRLGADMAGMTNISVKSETGEVTATFEVLPKEISQSTPQSTIVQMTERMTNNLIHSSDGNVKQMQIQLQPETLGNIVIKLESAQGEVSVKIIASNPEVRDMMAQASAQMSESIRAQGVNLSNIDVPQPSD